MDRRMAKRLLLIVSIVFMAIGIVFLCLSIFTQPKNTAYLSVALGSILLANVSNIIQMRAFGSKKG